MCRDSIVLVIDDEPDIASLIVALLDSEGYHPILASSGKDALDVLSGLRPSAIVLDLSLPDLDGVQLLRLLKSQRSTRRIPIIIVSAYTGRLSNADKAKIKDVFEKPFDLDRLVESVDRACEAAMAPAPMRSSRRKVSHPIVSVA